MSLIKRTLRFFAILLALVIPTVAVVTPASAASACAAVNWGSLPKVDGNYSTQPLTNIRSGQHACYDRLVFDLSGYGLGWTGFDVRYVNTVHQDGSGFPVPLAGGAKLQIVLHAPAYNDQGQPTYQPANRSKLANVTGYRTFRQVAWAGSFEGQTTVGLGVRARLPFRAFLLGGPGYWEQRLIVDVAHSWRSF